jgi:hypothetical protein
MRGVMSIYELSWEIYKGGGWLVTMISTDNGDLLQQQIRYNGKIIGNKRGRCNEGCLYNNVLGYFRKICDVRK